MEKYSNWRDLGTGIHPFLDEKYKFNFKIIIFFIKFVFLLMFWALYSIFGTIFLWRIIMFLLGFYDIKKGKLRYPTKGDLIVCNYSSFLTTFFFKSHFNSLIYGGTPSELNVFLKMAKQKNRCVLIYPERTSSNGKAILKFDDYFTDEIVRNTKIHVFGITYSSKYAQISSSFESKVLNFIKICSQFSSQMKISSGIFKPSVGNHCANIQKMCSDLSGLPSVNLSFVDKEKFIKYYFNKQK